MKETYSYRGHSIDLDVRKLCEGRGQCTYFIDANYCFQVDLDGDDLDNLRIEAVTLAHGSIDALNFLCPGDR